jgi:16S rRNA (guanine527-N7)-methyltransferase
LRRRNDQNVSRETFWAGKKEGLRAMTQDEFARLANVSRETETRLQAYAVLLNKWNSVINLVSASTLQDDPWRRHFWDSAQLATHIAPRHKVILDIGSGAGFPGLVLAILDGRPAVHLCESDRRKATFLREAARATGTAVIVHACRAEALDLPGVDLITARAVAPVGKILTLCERFLGDETQLLLLKGRQVHNELTEAAKSWNMEAVLHPSRSDDSGFILKIEKVARHDRRQTGPIAGATRS